MIIDLDNLYWYQARDILDYCLDKGIDLDNVRALKQRWASPIQMVDTGTPWVINIPDAHVNWLALKGLL